MDYILEKGLFTTYSEKKLIPTLEKFGLNCHWVDCLPFIDDLIFEDSNTVIYNPVMCFGSVKMAHLAKKYNWYPGSFYNDNHDFEVYSKYYKENLLNYDSKIQLLKDDVQFIHDFMFIRPCKDSKTFNGGLYDEIKWNEEFNKIKANWPNKLDEKIQVSIPKVIYKEIRCWIVGGQCVTTSQYKLGKNVNYMNYDFDTELIDYVNKMISIYQPADSFVIDICLTENGYKIIEINNLNCAGFYDSNIQKLIFALEERYNFTLH